MVRSRIFLGIWYASEKTKLPLGTLLLVVYFSRFVLPFRSSWGEPRTNLVTVAVHRTVEQFCCAQIIYIRVLIPYQLPILTILFILSILEIDYNLHALFILLYLLLL